MSFENFPYCNFHDMNLDWIINQWLEMKKSFANYEDAFKDLKEFVDGYFTNLDVQDEINKKLDTMASDGSLYALIENFTKPITDAQNNKIAVLESRMDTFTSLPSGSTSGDAELQDIRVSYTGVVYKTAGDATRGQAKELNSNKTNNPLKKANITRKKGYYGTNGFIANNKYRSAELSVSEGEKYYITCSGNGAFMPYYKYDENGTVITQEWENQKLVNYLLVIPQHCNKVGLNLLEAPTGMRIEAYKINSDFNITEFIKLVDKLEKNKLNCTSLYKKYIGLENYGIDKNDKKYVTCDYPITYGFENEYYSNNSIIIQGVNDKWCPIYFSKSMEFVKGYSGLEYIIVGKSDDYCFAISNNKNFGLLYVFNTTNLEFASLDTPVLKGNYDADKNITCIVKEASVEFYQEDEYLGTVELTNDYINQLELKRDIIINDVITCTGVIRSGNYSIGVKNVIKPKSQKTPYSDEYLVAFGDSQTTNGYYLDALLKGTEASWVQKEGVAGCTLTDDNSGKSICERVKKYDFTNYKLVLIVGGTNDFGTNKEIGIETDTSETTMCGSINAIISSIRNKKPKCIIVFVTPTMRLGGNVNNNLGYKLEDYANAIIKTCRNNRVPFVELDHDSNVGLSNLDSWTLDGLHWTIELGERIGVMIANKINTL
ncbi:MAG: SGNH hydrolase [Podoviridae sp. ctfa10]|nr:MAG: SGNH hydrolase [Podoviridae sp. ctfa10]